MSSFFLVKTAKGNLIPADEGDLDKLKKVPNGELVKCEYYRTRNYRFLKKFMALIRIGHDNTPLEMPFKAYRKLMTIRAGFFDTYDTGKGTMVEAQSISFESMKEGDFENVYNRVVDEIIKDLGCEKGELADMVAREF